MTPAATLPEVVAVIARTIGSDHSTVRHLYGPAIRRDLDRFPRLPADLIAAKTLGALPPKVKVPG